MLRDVFNLTSDEIERLTKENQELKRELNDLESRVSSIESKFHQELCDHEFQTEYACDEDGNEGQIYVCKHCGLED